MARGEIDLNIFICEDNKEQRKNLEKTIKKILIKKNISGKIQLSTNSAYEILDYLNESRNKGVYFLDIDIGQDINGIELASKINEIDKEAIIVMITSYSNMSHLIFKYHIRAVDYIVKDNIVGDYKRIEECLTFVDENLKKPIDNEYITIENNQCLEKVKYNDIIFFETTKKRTIALHTHNSYIEFKGTLKDIQEKLDRRFSRCHRSFIVNKDKVTKIDKKQRILFMEDGSKCLVSILLMNNVLNT
jgi:two-component system response regulator AgrA